MAAGDNVALTTDASCWPVVNTLGGGNCGTMADLVSYFSNKASSADPACVSDAGGALVALADIARASLAGGTLLPAGAVPVAPSTGEATESTATLAPIVVLTGAALSTGEDVTALIYGTDAPTLDATIKLAGWAMTCCKTGATAAGAFYSL